MNIRFPGAVVTIAAAAVIGVGGVVVSSGGKHVPSVPTAAPSNTANLWIDSNGGSCTFNASAIAYTGTGDSTSCSSTGAAYAAANAASASASTVAIRAGSYGDQNIPGSSRTGGYISFVESNGDVTFTNLFEMHGDKTQWIGMTSLRNVSVVPEPAGDPLPNASGDTSTVTNVIFDGWSAQGNGVSCTTTCDAAFFFKGVNGVTYKNGDICCGRATATADTKAIQNDGASSTNVTFDKVTVHDWGRVDGTVHTECALFDGVNGLTVSNSRFWNCPVYDISLARVGGSPDPANTLFENNIFEHTDDLVPGDRGAFFTLSLGHVTTRYQGLTLRNNSMGGAAQLFDVGDSGCPCDTPTGAYSLTNFYSNVIAAPTSGRCTTPSQSAGQPAWDGNVTDFASTTGCGTGHVSVGNALSMFVSPLTANGGDWHLGVGVAAIGAGSVSNSSATDIGSHSRDGSPDAGAYEFGSGS